MKLYVHLPCDLTIMHTYTAEYPTHRTNANEAKQSMEKDLIQIICGDNCRHAEGTNPA